MKHAGRATKVALGSLLLSLIVTAVVLSDPAEPVRHEFSAGELAKIRLRITEIESLAASAYMSDSNTYDAIIAALTQALNDLDGEPGKHTEPGKHDEPPDTGKAEWWEIETIKLFVTNLELVTTKEYTEDPASYETILPLLDRVIDQLKVLIKCSCSPAQPYCCCMKCQARPCDWGQCK
ncbi:MAG TPA: hypothetical protein VD788_07330 [Candidatus Polarisedimenticolaceae bacterium]|nr:hypothetical protein [Candidatus Polarisedimenticolaceae bacterium]